MTAEELADLPTESTHHMGREERVAGIKQMLADLDMLARKDGCIAAAWALELIGSLRRVEPPAKKATGRRIPPAGGSSTAPPRRQV